MQSNFTAGKDFRNNLIQLFIFHMRKLKPEKLKPSLKPFSDLLLLLLKPLPLEVSKYCHIALGCLIDFGIANAARCGGAACAPVRGGGSRGGSGILEC